MLTPLLGSRFRGKAMVAALGAFVLLLPYPALTQSVTTSPGPDAVSVTVYRDPNRQAERRMDLNWLNGFALVTETRTIAIPAGEADIRFEGVAGGIIPESAIVTGLPDGVVEKNQDAYLLSPASLIDRSLGRRVHLKRTDRATGAVREQEAIVRSGADGAVVLQTADGIEALRCTGLNETIVYDSVPPGLSARPTLSVRTAGTRAASATVTLSYLATGFDWQASYIARLTPAGDRVDLFAWVTLANGDETSFARANTQTVAGRLNREEVEREENESRPLNLQCWPSTTTSDLPRAEDLLNSLPQAFAPAPPPGLAQESIIVTGSRIAMKAQQEDLGDLKLYRIPEPVTVAAKSQKQVAMLEQSNVKVRQLYRSTLFSNGDDMDLRTIRILKTKNDKASGLGLPLPSGGVVLFAKGGPRPILLGEGAVEDKAVGEDVEIEVGAATGVIARVVKDRQDDDDSADFTLTVTNDQPRAIFYEAEFPGPVASFSGKFGRRNGRPLWAVTVPANGTARLRYWLAAD